MQANTYTKERKILYLAVIGLACMVALEGMVRIATRGPRWLNPSSVEISCDFAELDGLIADIQNTQTELKYYDEFLYAAAPVSTEHINFTDYYLRSSDAG